MVLRIALIGMIVCLGIGLAQTPAEKEVQQAEQAWMTAIKAADAAALDRILASDLNYTHATGIIDTKADYIRSITSGNQKYASVDESQVKIRTYGDTAVVNAKTRMTGATKGVPFDNQVLLIHVWVKKNGKWQLVAHQTTRLVP